MISGAINGNLVSFDPSPTDFCVCSEMAANPAVRPLIVNLGQFQSFAIAKSVETIGNICSRQHRKLQSVSAADSGLQCIQENADANLIGVVVVHLLVEGHLLLSRINDFLRCAEKSRKTGAMEKSI
jgi:hypothetical protein